MDKLNDKYRSRLLHLRKNRKKIFVVYTIANLIFIIIASCLFYRRYAIMIPGVFHIVIIGYIIYTFFLHNMLNFMENAFMGVCATMDMHNEFIEELFEKLSKNHETSDDVDA
jgi:hypothetical protein